MFSMSATQSGSATLGTAVLLICEGSTLSNTIVTTDFAGRLYAFSAFI